MKKKEEREKEEKKKKDSLLDDFKFSKAKLPKFLITKFDGSHFDWFRFWDQFESQINKHGLPHVSKFSYFKELLIPKVRLLFDSLPFRSEGYTRGKSILMT